MLGANYGYKGLISNEAAIKEFDFHHADRIFSRNGFIIIMSRFKPKDRDFKTTFFLKKKI